MNVALNPGAFASVLLMLLNGLGLPLGVPPEPEDPLLARVAPDDCLLYTSWSGMAEPDPDSTNQVEQMLAEAEVLRMLETIGQQLDLAAQKNPGMLPMGPLRSLAWISPTDRWNLPTGRGRSRDWRTFAF